MEQEFSSLDVQEVVTIGPSMYVSVNYITKFNCAKLLDGCFTCLSPLSLLWPRGLPSSFRLESV